MSTFGCRVRRQCRSVAILALGLSGLLMPATAAMSLAGPEVRTAAAAAPAERGEGLFAPAKPNARPYHQPGRNEGEGKSGSASAAVGFWMLVGLSLMLLAGALAPGGAPRQGRAQRR